MLIHGAHKTGSSMFSIVVVSQLFKAGSKLLFFTAFPQAKDSFFERVGKHHGIGVVNSMDDFEMNKDEQAIIVKSGDVKLLHEVVAKLDDLSERIVYLKNIDEYGASAFVPIAGQDKIIFQGDIDKSAFGEAIAKKDLKTKVFFTRPAMDLGVEIPDLEKYQGYLSSERSVGKVNLLEKK